MSNNEANGSIHGECAAEIHRLEGELRDKSEELACCESDILRWRTSYEHSCTQNVHLCAKIDDCRRFLKEGESPAEGLARFRSKITEVFGRLTLFMDAQKEALTEGGKTISIDRYKQIMAGLGMPNSQSLLCALQQVANEVGQKYSADAIELEDIADKARAKASMSDLKWQRVSHDKEALQDQLDACLPYLKEGETVADALARLSRLVNAVDCTDFYGIKCENIDGKNWFDVRGKTKDVT
jgi:hypothetical protein